MKKQFYIVLFLLLQPWLPSAFCQDTLTGAGKVEIIQDPKVDELVQKHIQINQALNTMDGFRIQVFSDSGNNSKSKANAVDEELRVKFPGMGVYLSFKSPNYRVRIGDFRTKLDAQRFLIELTADYPNAFLVTDQINLPKTN